MKTSYEMDTTDMKRIAMLNSEETLKLSYESGQLVERLQDIRETMQNGFLFSQIKDVVENYYDVGIVKDIYEIFGGYINRSFGVYTEKDGKRQTWFFRKYKRNKDLNELMLEHTLLIHAQKNGFELGAVPIARKDGTTYVELPQKMADGTTEPYCYAIYNFIPGSDTYDWIKNIMPEASYLSAANLIAEFHNSVRDFDPGSYQRDELPTDKFIEALPDVLKGYSKTYAENGYINILSEYLDEKTEYITALCRKAAIPPEDYRLLPVNPIQSDYHPANMKYDEAGIVTGIFDFDWAKVDLRLFEIGLGMVYCFTSWDTQTDGMLLLGDMEKFLRRYNSRLEELGGLTPLTSLEKKYLYEMLIIGDLYLVAWCTRACYLDMTLNPYEYFYYLIHLVRGLEWLENNKEEIRKLAGAL